MEKLLENVSCFITDRTAGICKGRAYREAADEANEVFRQLHVLIKDNADACRLLLQYEAAEGLCQAVMQDEGYKQGFKDALKIAVKDLN